MSNDGQLIFQIAVGFYFLGLTCAFFFSRRKVPTLLFLVPALLINALALGLRFRMAWPMLPLYAGPLALPFFTGLAAALDHSTSPDHLIAKRGILILTVVIALTGILFPKNFYIPFIKSQTVWAHLFFWFGVVGRACFLVAAAWAVAGLLPRQGDGEMVRKGEPGFSPRHPVTQSPHLPISHSTRWVIWGFAFWTLSMFTGELWSYMGWGTPVVWDEPAITTTMATWFFYICLLHLHLTGSWSARGRAKFTAAGAGVVLILTLPPDLGPFRWLF